MFFFSHLFSAGSRLWIVVLGSLQATAANRSRDMAVRDGPNFWVLPLHSKCGHGMLPCFFSKIYLWVCPIMDPAGRSPCMLGRCVGEHLAQRNSFPSSWERLELCLTNTLPPRHRSMRRKAGTKKFWRLKRIFKGWFAPAQLDIHVRFRTVLRDRLGQAGANTNSTLLDQVVVNTGSMIARRRNTPTTAQTLRWRNPPPPYLLC